MQKVAAERAGRGAVEFIAHHRMPDAGKMHADLVGTARTDFHFKKREFVEALQHLI